MAVTTSSKIMSAGSMEFGQVAPTVPSGIFFHSPIEISTLMVTVPSCSVSQQGQEPKRDKNRVQ